jgi:hypothetical protein
MSPDIYPLVTVLTLPMAARSCRQMFRARNVSAMEQRAQLLVTAALFAWLVVG